MRKTRDCWTFQNPHGFAYGLPPVLVVPPVWPPEPAPPLPMPPDPPAAASGLASPVDWSFLSGVSSLQASANTADITTM